MIEVQMPVDRGLNNPPSLIQRTINSLQSKNPGDILLCLNELNTRLAYGNKASDFKSDGTLLVIIDKLIDFLKTAEPGDGFNLIYLGDGLSRLDIHLASSGAPDFTLVDYTAATYAKQCWSELEIEHQQYLGGLSEVGAVDATD